MTEVLNDRRTIDVKNPADLARWCEIWGCSVAELREAIQVAGVRTEHVAAQLKFNGWKRV